MDLGKGRHSRAFSTRTQRRWRAWLASLTVTVLALAPLLAIFHQASTRHAVCEHGAFIEPDHAEAHAPEAIGAGANRSASEEAPSDGAAAFRADSSPIVHGHAHCTVGTLARAGTGVIPQTSFIASSLSLLAPEPRTCALPRARQILSIAPKTSPPAPQAHISA